ncbi:MAG: hypothetical protein M1347_02445 [Chloroflexi bacterium]|nr:hypothetical protein [Chloroflexota bacterium]
MTFHKAVDLYEAGKVTQVEAGPGLVLAIVQGRSPYRVIVETRQFGLGNCECYLGRHDYLCKHMVALSIFAVKSGQPLTEEEKRYHAIPTCSGRCEELTPSQRADFKNSITAAMRYIRPYHGPSRSWFSYQDSLSEGCNRLTALVSELPVNLFTAELIVNLLIRLDRKLCKGGVDDSDGTVGNFMSGVIGVLFEFITVDESCVAAFKKLLGRDICYEWYVPLVRELEAQTRSARNGL